jgi:hypothetical protein
MNSCVKKGVSELVAGAGLKGAGLTDAGLTDAGLKDIELAGGGIVEESLAQRIKTNQMVWSP